MWAKFTSSYLGNPTEISSGREHMADYSYDAMGRLSSALGGGMRYDYRYYEGGLLKEKRASERILTSYTYDAEGNVTSTYAYDELLNIKALKTEAGKQTLADNHYFYDGNGNQIRKEGLEGTTGYAYDGRNRLTEISYPSALGGYTEKLGYDAAGNRIRREFGVYKAKVEVNGIPKTANGGFSSFYPKSMSQQEVIGSINKAYRNRVYIRGNTYSGLTSSGMEIEMFLDKNGKIISAYPVY